MLDSPNKLAAPHAQMTLLPFLALPFSVFFRYTTRELRRPRLEASSTPDATDGEDLAASSFFAHSPTHEAIRGAIEAMRSRFNDANRREEERAEGRGLLRFRVVEETPIIQRVRESIFQELCGMEMGYGFVYVEHRMIAYIPYHI